MTDANDVSDEKAKARPEDRRRKRILQYAWEKFAVIGYSNVSIAEFAQELKMSKSTFYKFFSSKEELLFALMEDFYARFESEIGVILADAQLDTGAKLRRFLLLVRGKFSSLQVAAVQDLQRSVPEAFELMEERRRRIVTGSLVRLFEQGAEEGRFRRDVPPAVTANLLLHALQAMEHPDFIAETPYTFAEMFQYVFSLVLEGSLTEQGRQEFRSGGEMPR